MYELNEMDVMIEAIFMAIEEHGCKCADGHWLTEEEVFSMSEEQIIDLFKKIYGRV